LSRSFFLGSEVQKQPLQFSEQKREEGDFSCIEEQPQIVEQETTSTNTDLEVWLPSDSK
jgi:hypothetical protein